MRAAGSGREAPAGAAGSPTIRVEPAPASRLPGDMPIDIDPGAIRVVPAGSGRAVIQATDGRETWALLGDDRAASRDRRRTIEVVVDGWRFELEVEDTARSELRGRATRERRVGAGDGPLEVRAIIPGRVVAVGVAAGDTVTAGQTLLVIEAMKMQNELRAPRDGRVDRVAIEAGDTIDLGDLLLVLG
jgi:biotin carboxyl carrier protein